MKTVDENVDTVYISILFFKILSILIILSSLCMSKILQLSKHLGTVQPLFIRYYHIRTDKVTVQFSKFLRITSNSQLYSRMYGTYCTFS